MALGLIALVATCTDNPSGPAHGVFGRGYLALRPILVAPVSLASFDLTIDTLRVIVIRPATDTVADTSAYFPPNQNSLGLAIPVLLQAPVETLLVHFQLKAGSQVLFTGSDSAVVKLGIPDTATTATIPLKYVGPGSGITKVTIAPRDSVVTLTGTQKFRVTAESLGVAVDSFYVSWSTSDTAVAKVNAFGLLQAPNARGAVYLRVVTPNGVRDSTRVTFVPVPAALNLISGSGQSGVVSTTLPQPLRVQVKGSDSLGIKGVGVHFSATAGGGSVRDSVVVTDSLGNASDSATLGPLTVPQTFQASVTALAPVSFAATATAGPITPAKSTITVSTGALASGVGATVTLQGRDAGGNAITIGGATVLFSATGGTSTGTFSAVTDNGNGTYTATFTGVTAGTATTIGGTINGVAVSTVLPTITVTPGAASAVTSIVTVDSATLASGHAALVRLQAKDAAGNSLATGGATVVFSDSGGTSTGTIGSTTDNANGAYTATFTGVLAGTATSIKATLNGVTVATSRPTVTVLPGAASAVTSLVTVDSTTLASGHVTTLHLQAKDAAGNNLTAGGATVVFSDSGGTSTGTIGSTTDNANGTYSATFTGVVAGAATSIKATLNGTTVSTPRPTVVVVPGVASAAAALVTVDSGVLASGHVTTLRLQAKDAAGNSLTTGGATVVFSDSGGTSTGTVGATTTDNGNGTYTATFTGVLAGTATTIHATFNGTAVTNALPTVTVAPGAASLSQSVVTVTSGTVASGAQTTITLQAKDAAGNAITTGGLTVAFTNAGGTSTGTISATTDHANGTYTATFTGLVAGTATTIGATIGASPVTSTLPAVTVVPGNAVTAQSVVSVSTGTVASGGLVTLTLQAKDSVGNNLTSGGLTVVFNHSGGTSSGTIGVTTDNGNGTYTASFVGTLAGTPTTIGATINTSPVTSTLPTITVTPGAISAATSVVGVSLGSILSGGTSTLTLQAKDAAGNNLGVGGATVVFSNSGGTSTGTIGSTTDNGNGTYSATFTGVVAGSATTIGATINSAAVTTTLPLITVTPGATATVAVAPATVTLVALGRTQAFSASAKDAAGNTVAGETFSWSTSNVGIATVNAATGLATATGPGTATITATAASNSKTGNASLTIAQVVKTVVVAPAVDTARAFGDSVLFTAVAKDSSDSVATGQTFAWTSSNPAVATVNAATGRAHAVTNGTVTITATDGSVSGTASFVVAQKVATVTVSPDTITVTVGATPTFTAVAKDSNANVVSAATFVWASTNTAVATINAGTGVATAVGTGVDTITATSSAVIGRATLTVSSTVHAADITSDQTWTLAQSPHRVTGFLRIRNGATLTIQPGVTVKFDAASGLQVGDTGLGQTGGLVLDGTTSGITLTANSASPTAGFWRGLEVQRSLAVLPWRKVLLEWAGGSGEPCIHIADRLGAALDLDSLHLRQCAGGGLLVTDGTDHLHRSIVDSTGATGAAATNGTLEVDSTTFRGVGTGIQFPNAVAHFGPSSFNRFLGDGAPLQLTAFQLAGLLVQDTIDNNTSNVIALTAGLLDPAVASATLFRQPRPRPSGFDYHVVSGAGQLNVGRAGGQELVIDSSVAIGFDPGTGIVIGDSTGTRSGTLRSLGTTTANAGLLDGFSASVPGSWVGVEIGRLAATDTLRYVHLQSAGDSIPGYTRHRAGLWIRNPVAVPLVLDHLQVNGNGLAGDPTNSVGIGVTASGGGLEVRLSDISTNQGYGLVLPDRGFYVHGNTFNANVIGVGAFTQGGSQLGAGDSLVSNVYTGSKYALSLSSGVLRALYDTVLGGNNTDTLLLSGGQLTADARLPHVPGFVWHATGMTTVDSNATFTIAAGDTVAFDTLAGIFVGSNAPAGLRAVGAAGNEILLTRGGPGVRGWFGIQWNRPSSNNAMAFVTVDRAGFVVPCGTDCNNIPFAALRFGDTTSVNLTLDHMIVQRSGSISLDFTRQGSGTLAISNSQFYLDPSPVIRMNTGRGNQLSITGSDIYAYRGTAVTGTFAGLDSIDATNNWWGDVSGLNINAFNDSLGRGGTAQTAVRFVPFAAAPFFPVGPGVALRAARDTILLGPDSVLSAVGQTDSLRVRLVDANGRGTPSGPTPSWVATSGTVTGSGSPDQGGRSGTVWLTGSASGNHTVTATSIGAPVVFPLSLLPGNTLPTTVRWRLDPGYTLGAVSPDSQNVTFTSTNRRARVITHARDGHGNATQPNQLCFADVGGGCDLSIPNGVDSLKGDTIYFHPTVLQPAAYQLSGLFESGQGGGGVVTLSLVTVPSRIQINQDTAQFNSLCRTSGPFNTYCQRTFTAAAVDSGGTIIPGTGVGFQWRLQPAGDTTVTIDAVTGTDRGIATISAHQNGPIELIAHDSSGLALGEDTLAITVNQLTSQIVVVPDTVSGLVGGATTFVGHALDQGSDTVSNAAIHWRIDGIPHLTITDTSVVRQVTVRLDSTPLGQAAVTAFVVRGPGDTVFGLGNVVNPVARRLGVGSNPIGIAANSVSNRVYVANIAGTDLSVIDGATDAVGSPIHVGPNPNYIAIDEGLNKLYVTTDSGGASLAVVDGATGALLTTLDVGSSPPPQGVAV
ncbi:MAG TPA: invasin domain 3-containing protein, partial [Gemmatimonadales bacterium]|nr:invasin domain 3-containing protein [Gemmatimonadales bacterium]